MEEILYNTVTLLTCGIGGLIIGIVIWSHMKKKQLYEKEYIQSDGLPKKCWHCGSTKIRCVYKMVNGKEKGIAKCKECGRRLGTYKNNTWEVLS